MLKGGAILMVALFVQLQFQPFASASTLIEVDGLTYSVQDDNTLTVEGCTTKCGTKNLVIPAFVQSMPVRKIDVAALSDKKLSGSLTLPSSVTAIYRHAFSFNKITSVIFGDSPVLMFENVFTGNKIDSFVSPTWLTHIPRDFMSENPLHNLVLSPEVIDIGDQAFDNSNMPTLVLPATLKSIGANAFSNADRGVNQQNPQNYSYPFSVIFMGDPPTISERALPFSHWPSGGTTETKNVTLYVPQDNSNWGSKFGYKSGGYVVRKFDPTLLDVASPAPVVSQVVNVHIIKPEGNATQDILFLKVAVSGITSVEAETSPATVKKYQTMSCPLGTDSNISLPIPGFKKTSKFFFCSVLLSQKKWSKLNLTAFRYGLNGTTVSQTRVSLTGKKVQKYSCHWTTAYRAGPVCKKL